MVTSLPQTLPGTTHLLTMSLCFPMGQIRMRVTTLYSYEERHKLHRLRIKGLVVQFPVRAHAWVVGQVSSRGARERQPYIDVSLSLSFSFPSPLSNNKYINILQKTLGDNIIFKNFLKRKGATNYVCTMPQLPCGFINVHVPCSPQHPHQHNANPARQKRHRILAQSSSDRHYSKHFTQRTP